MKIVYLASRYSRKQEMHSYRSQLECVGLRVNSRWLNGPHQISDDGKPIGDTGELLVEEGGAEAENLRTKLVQDDVQDVKEADTLIAFTEPPRSGHSRGGRHVELGMAIGMGKQVVVVGPRENLFTYLPGIRYYQSWYGREGALYNLTGHSFCSAPCSGCGDIDGCHNWQLGVQHYGTLTYQLERTGRL